MSLQLRNELRLRLGPRRCEAAIWCAGVQTRCTGRASAEGRGVEGMEQALAALEAEGHRLPSIATLCVEDEFVYFATQPATGSWAEARDDAVDFFEATIGGEDLMVETCLAPCGSVWVAVAIDRGRVDAWRAALAGRDIEMRHVRAALLEDLWAIRGEVPGGDAVLAMLRNEGATMVALREGCITDINWERCDLAELDSLSQRLEGGRARLAQSLGVDSATAVPLLLVPQDSAQHGQMSTWATDKGWHLTGALLAGQA